MLPLLPLQRRMVRGGKRRRPLLQLQQRSSSVPMRPILLRQHLEGPQQRLRRRRTESRHGRHQAPHPQKLQLQVRRPQKLQLRAPHPQKPQLRAPRPQKPHL